MNICEPSVADSNTSTAEAEMMDADFFWLKAREYGSMVMLRLFYCIEGNCSDKLLIKR